MLYGDMVICETISCGKRCQTHRKLSLGLTSQRLNLLRRGLMHILILLLLPGHGLENPSATRFEEKAGGRIRKHIRNCHGNSLDRVHTDADVPAACAFAEHHLPYLGIYENLF